jgi:hypothetical protein
MHELFSLMLLVHRLMGGILCEMLMSVDSMCVISLRRKPIVNVNENVLKLVSCLISFCMHLSWHSACMYCAVK